MRAIGRSPASLRTARLGPSASRKANEPEANFLTFASFVCLFDFPERVRWGGPHEATEVRTASGQKTPLLVGDVGSGDWLPFFISGPVPSPSGVLPVVQRRVPVEATRLERSKKWLECNSPSAPSLLGAGPSVIEEGGEAWLLFPKTGPQ